MRNNLSKFTKAFTSMACFSLILISNNSELAARYLLDKEAEFKKIKGKILLDVADIIAEHGAEIAYPTQTLHIQKPA